MTNHDSRPRRRSVAAPQRGSGSAREGALAQLEWVTNFGLDAESLKAHPGESVPGPKESKGRGGGRER